jgi:hypothetical protein
VQDRDEIVMNFKFEGPLSLFFMRGIELFLRGLLVFFGVLRRLASCVFVVVGDRVLCGLRCYGRGWCELFRDYYFYLFSSSWSGV